MSPRLRRVARAGVLVAALALPLVAAAVQARRELAPDGIGTDDAFIFLRYGRNLAHGLGWVWNPGGEPVEGATSTLWTLLAAAGYRLTSDPSDLMFGASLALVVLALALWLAALIGPGAERSPAGEMTSLAMLALAVGLDLAARPAFAVWTAASLMDGGLWCAATLSCAATLALVARAGATGGALAAACAAQVVLALARPEAMLVGPALVVTAALASPRPQRLWLAPLAAAAATQAALLLWRLSTFGWPLPNTYYAKVGDDLGARWRGGLDDLAAAVREDPTHLLAWSLAGFVLATAVRVRRRGGDRSAGVAGAALALAAAGALLAPAILLFEGGDQFPGQRLLVQFRPFQATLFAALLLRALTRSRGAKLAAFLTAAALGLGASLSYLHASARWGALERTSRLGVEFGVAREWFAFGGELNRHFGAAPRPPEIGVFAAGALPFVYRGPSRDLLGLTDPAMAHASRRREGIYGHAAFSTRQFFERPPDLLIAGPTTCEGTPREKSNQRLTFRNVLRDVDLDPRFRSLFRRARFLEPAGQRSRLCLFARREWLDSGASGARWEAAEAPSGRPAGGSGPTR